MSKMCDWLCRLLCGQRLFNEDMSLELDTFIDAYERTCADNEVLRRKLIDLEKS